MPPASAGCPRRRASPARLEAWLAKHADMPGAPFLSAMVPYAVKTFGFEPDAFVHELVDSIIGDNYPVPDRMLVHNERIVHEYLDVGDVRETRGRRASSTSTRSRAGRRRCATSSSR